MRTIINNTDKKEFIKSYRISGGKGGDFTVVAHIKNMGYDVKITQLEFKKNVVFTFEGKERTEPTALRFKDADKNGMLYSYEYEFAGHKFSKNYVKDEYETEKALVQALPNTDIYKVVEKKTPLNPTLEEIWEDYLKSEISTDFRYLMDTFDEYLYYKGHDKIISNRILLAKMFMDALKFDKKETINYELNPDEITFKLFTSKTR